MLLVREWYDTGNLSPQQLDERRRHQETLLRIQEEKRRRKAFDKEKAGKEQETEKRHETDVSPRKQKDRERAALRRENATDEDRGKEKERAALRRENATDLDRGKEKERAALRRENTTNEDRGKENTRAKNKRINASPEKKNEAQQNQKRRRSEPEVKENAKRRRKERAEEEFLSEEEKKKLSEDFAGRLKPISPEVLQEVHAATTSALTEGLEGAVCAVCDRRHNKRLIKNISITPDDKFVKLCIKKLYPRQDYHQGLLAEYRIDHPLLLKVLLSPRGYDSNLQSLGICKECRSALSKKKAKGVPPKFSIANGFAIGLLPEKLWDKATPIDFRLTAKKTLAASRLLISGGPHGHLKGHVTIFDNNMTTAAEVLPRLFNVGDTPEELYVVFAGTNADRDRLLCLRRNLCDMNTTLDLLAAYRYRRTDYQSVREFSCFSSIL